MHKTIYDIPPKVDNAIWLKQGEYIIIAPETAIAQFEATGELHRVYVNEKCSNCFMQTSHDNTISYKYCPHCGSKMKQAWNESKKGG